MIQKAKPLSDEDEFLIEWARESKKYNMTIANDVLGKIATLSATIIGGGVIFLNKSVIPEYLVVPVLIFFLISLSLSFKGMLPYGAEIDLYSPTEIKVHKSKALNYKLKHIKVSASCFFIGLFLAVVGVGCKSLCQ